MSPLPAPRITYATALVAKLKGILDESGLDKVTVTLDAQLIESGSREGIVVVTPPDIEFPTFTQTEITPEFAVIAGPRDNLEAAWTRLDEIIEAFRLAQIEMVDAKADMFAVAKAAPIPGYAVTLQTDTIIDESETP